MGELGFKPISVGFQKPHWYNYDMRLLQFLLNRKQENFPLCLSNSVILQLNLSLVKFHAYFLLFAVLC